MRDMRGARAAVLNDSVIRLTLAREGIVPDACEVSFSYINNEEIRALNQKYRGKDEETDVLSFPMYEGIEEIRAALLKTTAPVLLGDVVICREVAARQAEEYGHSAEREEVYLLIHGILHLLGYDHMDSAEKRVMREKEEALIKELDIDLK